MVRIPSIVSFLCRRADIKFAGLICVAVVSLRVTLPRDKSPNAGLTAPPVALMGVYRVYHCL